MHGRGGEERKRGRHMLTVPTRVSVADGSSSSSSSSPNSFFKVWIFGCFLISCDFGSLFDLFRVFADNGLWDL